MPAKLKLYAMPGAQPSRTALQLLVATGTEFELVMTSPLDGSTGTSEFLSINPFGAVPALVVEEDGKSVTLTDLSGIVSYISDIKDSPVTGNRDALTRARIKALVTYAQTEVRKPSTYEIFVPLIRKMLGAPGAAGLTQEQIDAICGPNKSLEGVIVDLSRAAGWVKPHYDATPDEDKPDSAPFLVGSTVTVADMAVFSELHQVEILGLLDGIKTRRPMFARWCRLMAEVPWYKETTSPLLAFAEKMKGGLPKVE